MKFHVHWKLVNLLEINILYIVTLLNVMQVEFTQKSYENKTILNIDILYQKITDFIHVSFCLIHSSIITNNAKL